MFGLWLGVLNFVLYTERLNIAGSINWKTMIKYTYYQRLLSFISHDPKLNLGQYILGFGLLDN